MSEAVPAVSVVIPTRDRPELAAASLRHVLDACDALGRDCEVLVVDDGSAVPFAAALDVGSAVPFAPAVDDARVVVLRTHGVGPARARNLGIAHARAPVVAFTDDDVQVDPSWLVEALAVLDGDPTAAGVTGCTVAPPFDPLYEHAVSDGDGGSFLTCNVAYRTGAVRAVGGFDRQFPHAAHEDRDLAWRVRDAVGPVRFNPAMLVTHPGRRIDLRAWDRRGWLVVDDWLLYRRFPGAKASRLGVRVAPLASMTRRWADVARQPGGIDGSPARAVRWARLAGGQLLVGSYVVATQWRHHRDRATAPTPGLERGGLRVAYVGPVPGPSLSGAPGVAGMLLRELAQRGATIDCYVATSAESDDTAEIASVEGVEVLSAPSRFAFERWYSRHPLSKMASSQLAAALARRRLAGTLAARHRALPYDVCYQFANLESFGVPSRRDDRPPLVMHPAVHAAGELRWLRAERPLAQGLEGSVQPALVRAWLTARALRQRRDARRADRVLALSAAFGRLLVEDCGVAPERVTVVPDCIDLERFAPLEDATASVATVASVGRLAVRKGLEDVVALSSSLRDLEGEVELAVVGGGSLWSDYSGLLEGLDPSVGRALGRLDREEVRQLVAASRCVLQLSRYEPFGLTVAEALACGVPVVVTPAVGAAEGLPAEVARVVEPGDVAAVDAAVRELLSLAPDERAFLAARCRHAARRFAPDVVAAALYEALVEVASPATRAAGTVE